MHSREQYFFDELDKETMDKLADIIDLQFKMIELSRKHGRKKEPQIAICLDDISDNPRFSKNPLLTKLYSRGRHANITTVCSVHRSRGILKPVVRSQVTGSCSSSSAIIWSYKLSWKSTAPCCQIGTIWRGYID